MIDALSDPGRLAALARTGLLDTPVDEAFDRLTRLVCKALEVPAATVSLIDDRREFFKSCIGLGDPWASAREVPLTHSLCRHAIGMREPLVVPDAAGHPLTAGSPAVAEVGIRALLAVPLVTSDGHALGCLCALDRSPRPWTPQEIEVLADLAGATMTEIDLRAAARLALERADEVERLHRERTSVLESMSDAFFALDGDWLLAYVNREGQRLLGRPAEELVGRPAMEVWPPALGAGLAEAYRRQATDLEPAELEVWDPEGHRWLEVRATPAAEGLSVWMRDVTARKAAERRIAAQHAATRALAESTTLDEAGPRVLRAVCESLGWRVGVLWRLDPAAGVLRFLAVWTVPGADVAEFERRTRSTTFPPGVGLPGRVLAGRKPAWIPDVVSDPNFPRAAAAAGGGLHAAFGFPILSGPHVLGVMEFFTHQTLEPDRVLLDLMADVGSQLGELVERARAEQQLHFQKALLESQSEAAIDGILVVSGDGRIVSANGRFAEMWGIPEEVIATGSDEAALEAVLDFLVDPAAFLARVRDLYAHPDAHSREEILLKDGRTFDRYSAPLRGADGVHYGRVWYFRDVTERKRAEEERSRLLALEQRARVEAEAAQRRLTFLAEASRLLAGSLDHAATLSLVARLAVPYIADWCTVHVVEPDRSIAQVAVAHVDPSKVEMAHELSRRYPFRPSDHNPVHRVVTQGRSELVYEIGDAELVAAAHDADHLRLLRQLGLTSYMCVPLMARGRILGALTLASAEPGRRYAEADLTLAEQLAHRAALAVDNARLFEERVEVARTLQQSLLPPQLPTIRGVELAARYRPAAEAADIGGDFYDVFRIGRRRWMLAIGDVCGKGVEAAALTALARYTLRAAAMQEREPRKVLGVLNEAIRQQVTHERFSTVLCARLDRASGSTTLTVASGGHPLPLLLRAGGRVEEAGRPGGLLGVFADPVLADESVELEPGDAVVFYTDGLTESGVPGGPSDEELVAVLGACRGLAAEGIAATIEREVLGAQPDDRRDDAAMLVLRLLV